MTAAADSSNPDPATGSRSARWTTSRAWARAWYGGRTATSPCSAPPTTGCSRCATSARTRAGRCRRASSTATRSPARCTTGTSTSVRHGGGAGRGLRRGLSDAGRERRDLSVHRSPARRRLLMKSDQVLWPSCQRDRHGWRKYWKRRSSFQCKLASRIGLTADVF